MRGCEKVGKREQRAWSINVNDVDMFDLGIDGDNVRLVKVKLEFRPACERVGNAVRGCDPSGPAWSYVDEGNWGGRCDK